MKRNSYLACRTFSMASNSSGSKVTSTLSDFWPLRRSTWKFQKRKKHETCHLLKQTALYSTLLFISSQVKEKTPYPFSTRFILGAASANHITTERRKGGVRTCQETNNYGERKMLVNYNIKLLQNLHTCVRVQVKILHQFFLLSLQAPS